MRMLRKFIILNKRSNYTSFFCPIIANVDLIKYNIYIGIGDIMKKNKNTFLSLISKIIYVFIIALILITGDYSNNVTVSNVNAVKSLKSNRIFKESEPIKLVYSTDEIKKFGPYRMINFTGTITGYGPDCQPHPEFPGSVACSGLLACNGKDVRNGDIYYNDTQFGKVRIVAADSSIPCGSMISISNFKYYNNGKPFYAIVLDRGAGIKGLTMDLLYPSEYDAVHPNDIGRQRQISFTIARWGY